MSISVWNASGGLPKRPKGSDCNSAGSAFGGSNPSPTTTRKIVSEINTEIPPIYDVTSESDGPARLMACTSQANEVEP